MNNDKPFHVDELSLNEFVGALRRARWLILSLAVASILIAVVAVLVTPKTYTASTVLSPVTNTPGGGGFGRVDSLLSQFGGLASLAGFSGLNDTSRSESLAVLQSEALTEAYVQKNDLLPILYARKWDAQRKQWTERNPRKVPTLWKANEDFTNKIRQLNIDSKTGLVTLRITWKDPQVAADWANGLVKMTNEYLRDKAIRESQRNIAYLNDQATKTDVVGVKQAIFTILQNEINKEMLARGSEEYALKVLDPAFAPEKPSSPKPVLWVSLALFGSLLLSLVLVFLRTAWDAG